MCGIAGLISGHDQASPATRMAAAMSHRGPDDHGLASAQTGDRWVNLASTRLAILDLSPAGHMPMLDPATGNQIVFNGEIYNFRELRTELAAHGEAFSSGTDTEVVLKGYARWGRELLARLRGMFAFAIWDHRAQELFLARDRLGEKPLYYHSGTGETFLFASEVRALLASGLVERKLDQDALQIYLSNGFMLSPLTAVRGVRSLLPAHWMRVSRNGRILETAQYWRMAAVRPPAGPESEEELRETLEEAVRIRMASDVPIGAFLSGGLDSSILVALMARSGARVRTFSAAFDETAYDESIHAAWVAKHFGTEHNEVRLRQADVAHWLPDALGAMDQPTFDGINTYCVSRAAKASGLTVALSGLGADELFGGYPYFDSVPWVRRAAALAGRLPGWITCAPLSRGLQVSAPWKLAEAWGPASRNGDGRPRPALAAYQAAQLLFPWWVRDRLLPPGEDERRERPPFGLPKELLKFLDAETAETAETGRDNTLSLLSLRLFLGQRCLRDSDAMSMAVSLEIRTAFTDHLFLEAALKVPASVRTRGAPNKPFLARLFAPCLGPDYPIRPKQGFCLPLDLWLRSGSILEAVAETMSNRPLLAASGLDPGGVQSLLEAYRSGRPRIPWSRLWALHVFTRWCETNRISC